MVKGLAVSAVRALTLVTATAAMVGLGALPAAAAPPPSNDTVDGAKVITAPFTETVDTTEATTDDDDRSLNLECGAPATNGTVWYSVTAGAGAYVVDVSQSTFTAGVMVVTGPPDALSVLTCGPNSVAFETTPGTRYYLLAFSDNPDVVGGQLTISVTETPARPKVSMTIDDVGRVNARTGVVTVSGTYTCEGQADIIFVRGRLSQRQGDVFVVGSFERVYFECDGLNLWTAEITPESGTFRRGDAATIALTAGCNQMGCNSYEELDTIRLRGGR
jgi:uncharacterized protein DUF6299